MERCVSKTTSILFSKEMPESYNTWCFPIPHSSEWKVIDNISVWQESLSQLCQPCCKFRQENRNKFYALIGELLVTVMCTLNMAF